MKICWDSSNTVSGNAGQNLPQMARGFFKAGRKLEAAETSLESLHRFRLLTKRFRYSLELFRPCYGPGLALRIEALRTVQQHLGEINDCATTRDLILKREDLSRAARNRLVRDLKRQASGRVAKFRRLWQQEFAAPGRERWWTGYLSRFANPPR